MVVAVAEGRARCHVLATILTRPGRWVLSRGARRLAGLVRHDAPLRRGVVGPMHLLLDISHMSIALSQPGAPLRGRSLSAEHANCAAAVTR